MDRRNAASQLTATLVINITSSYCGNCRKPVMPKSIRHDDICGWTPKPGGGCGALFIDMRSDYVNLTSAELLRVRPDLPIREPQGRP
jgi:hypothetical protein